MKQEGTKFKTLKEAMDHALSYDCDKVTEYKFVYHPPKGTPEMVIDPEYWTAKRKFMTNRYFGKAEWLHL
jgi:hypothetical protein